MVGKTQLLQFLHLKILEILHIETSLARGCDSFQDLDTAAHQFLLLPVKILVPFWKLALCVCSLASVLGHLSLIYVS